MRSIDLFGLDADSDADSGGNSLGTPTSSGGFNDPTAFTFFVTSVILSLLLDPIIGGGIDVLLGEGSATGGAWEIGSKCTLGAHIGIESLGMAANTPNSTVGSPTTRPTSPLNNQPYYYQSEQDPNAPPNGT